MATDVPREVRSAHQIRLAGALFHVRVLRDGRWYVADWQCAECLSTATGRLSPSLRGALENIRLDVLDHRLAHTLPGKDTR
jgi:hypothetical protein